MEFDQDFYLGLATILKMVIEEAEEICLTACDDYNSVSYLLYQPMYPWYMDSVDRDLTEEKTAEIFRRYISILTDDPIDIGYQEVENGG